MELVILSPNFFPCPFRRFNDSFLVPNGPYRKQSQGINLSALIGVFENQNLRSAAFGYFGHIYAFGHLHR
jgi:hypothetical protein